VKPYSVQTFTAFPLVIREQDGAQLSELRRRILERGEQNSALVDREPEQFHAVSGGTLERRASDSPLSKKIGVWQTHGLHLRRLLRCMATA
jgi:hypothetical protein